MYGSLIRSSSHRRLSHTPTVCENLAAAENSPIARTAAACSREVVVGKTMHIICCSFIESSIGEPRQSQGAATRQQKQSISRLLVSSYLIGLIHIISNECGGLHARPHPALEQQQQQHQQHQQTARANTSARTTQGDGKNYYPRPRPVVPAVNGSALQPYQFQQQLPACCSPGGTREQPQQRLINDSTPSAAPLVKLHSGPPPRSVAPQVGIVGPDYGTTRFPAPLGLVPNQLPNSQWQQQQQQQVLLRQPNSDYEQQVFANKQVVQQAQAPLVHAARQPPPPQPAIIQTTAVPVKPKSATTTTSSTTTSTNRPTASDVIRPALLADPRAWHPLYKSLVSLQNPLLLGGDILVRAGRPRRPIATGIARLYKASRSALVDPVSLWPDGVIFYELDDSVAHLAGLIWRVMQQFHLNTCIRFLPRHHNEPDFVRIAAHRGCSSYIGRIGGEQTLSLGDGCEYRGTVAHELLHAVGFYHHQNRSDRDDFLEILWENVAKGKEDQFRKMSAEENFLLTEFDYNSIMLYGPHTFGKTLDKITMKPKREGVILLELIEKRGLSALDIDSVNKLYKCGSRFSYDLQQQQQQQPQPSPQEPLPVLASRRRR